MQSEYFIFFDKKGKRWPRVRGLLLGSAACFLVGLIAFINALFVSPRLRPPAEASNSPPELLARTKPAEVIRNPIAPPEWLRRPPPQKSAPPSSSRRIRPALPSVRLAFYADWDPRSFQSLKRNYKKITHIAPEWFSMTDSSGELMYSGNDELHNFTAESGLKLLPLLSNLTADTWHPEAVENLARGSPERQQLFFSKVAAQLTDIKAQGVLIDWQQIDPSYRDDLTYLLGGFSEALHQKELELWLSIPVEQDLRVFDLDSLAGFTDRFVALLFDQTGEFDEPGPISSAGWFSQWLNALKQHGRAEQWVIGIGNFGYDWEDNKPARTISFADTMARASFAGETAVQVFPPDYSPHFYYTEKGVNHAVWFLDALTFRNQRYLARQAGVGGIAISRLGLEDPAIWSVLKTRGEIPMPTLQRIKASRALAHIGTGELLTFNDSRKHGERIVAAQPDGLWTAKYQSYPRNPVIFHKAATDPHEVALTFDDGPDPEWTPRILDILETREIKASFFVLGSKAAGYPGLIRRILQQGHLLGNHSYSHPNLSEVSSSRIMLELNSTQRVIESITGKSMLLFRPPYNADTNPSSLAECFPVSVAQSLGYITMMQSIDSEDWRKDSIERIVGRVRARRREGNVILLHDGGGDRSMTVDALPQIIDYLSRRGDSIVPLSSLFRISPASLMPPLAPDQEKSPQVIARTGFAVIFAVEELSWAFMIAATILVVLRTLVVIILAVCHKRRESRAGPAPGAWQPPVSVVIAAFNESRVIQSTLRSIAGSAYSGVIEIVIVDDGSRDDTAEIVEQLIAQHPRIRLIRQENMGKAHALKTALGAASHEIIVMLDADTQFTPDTISRLVAPLMSPQVGAVSGHVKVGNLRTIIARFQSLEYACGFNLDRRAYDMWNCITVAPGAVSAFKRSAITAAGGISPETLAEDTDLTLQMHRIGLQVRYTSRAVAWTEAPETFRGLLRQRKRWAFGTIQCLWKHRDLVFNPKFKALAFFSLPSVWFFHLFLVALIPIVDLMLIVSLVSGSGGAIAGYAIGFLLIDLLLAAVSCRMEKEKLTLALYIIPMRLVYRPLLSWAVLCSIQRMLKGAWVGWDKQERKGSVRIKLVHGLGRTEPRKAA